MKPEDTNVNVDREQPAPAAETRRMAPRVDRFPTVKPKFAKEQFGSGEGTGIQDGTTLSEGVALSEGVT